MTEKVVKLERVYEAFGKTFDVVVLREPTGADYWHLGPIAEWQPAPSGEVMVTWHDKIKAYAERLMKVPDGMDGVAMLAALSLPDTLKIERAVKDFFIEAQRSSTPPTS